MFPLHHPKGVCSAVDCGFFDMPLCLIRWNLKIEKIKRKKVFKLINYY